MCGLEVIYSIVDGYNTRPSSNVPNFGSVGLTWPNAGSSGGKPIAARYSTSAAAVSGYLAGFVSSCTDIGVDGSWLSRALSQACKNNKHAEGQQDDRPPRKPTWSRYSSCPDIRLLRSALRSTPRGSPSSMVRTPRIQAELSVDPAPGA
eukprot:scaffold23482_cov32-Tisochrysis_lutea.AAC.3